MISLRIFGSALVVGFFVACASCAPDPASPQASGTDVFTKDMAVSCQTTVDDCVDRCQHHRYAYCTAIGLLYVQGASVAKDVNKASGLFSSACHAGELNACDNLAVAYQQGKGGLAKDEVKAAALFDRACTATYADACSNLGVMIARGEGVAPDVVRAASLYARACDGHVALPSRVRAR